MVQRWSLCKVLWPIRANMLFCRQASKGKPNITLFICTFWNSSPLAQATNGACFALKFHWCIALLRFEWTGWLFELLLIRKSWETPQPQYLLFDCTPDFLRYEKLFSSNLPDISCRVVGVLRSHGNAGRCTDSSHFWTSGICVLPCLNRSWYNLLLRDIRQRKQLCIGVCVWKSLKIKEERLIIIIIIIIIIRRRRRRRRRKGRFSCCQVRLQGQMRLVTGSFKLCSTWYIVNHYSHFYCDYNHSVP